MPKRILALLLLSALSTGCTSIGYYSQSIKGHMQVWWPQKDVDLLITDPETDAKLRERLKSAKQIRRFASDRLELPRNDSYTRYTDLGRPHVVWNVVAAPEFSLKAKTWCYLVVGCHSYRGYFGQQEALSYAESLRAQSYDVSVGGVTAYSTLGWFDDPLLNTMMKWSDRRLAGLIFHELSHQVVYITNDTSFNEAFASAVERMGILLWLRDTQPEQIENYLSYLQQKGEFRQLLLKTRTTLEELYASDQTEDTKRQDKAKIFERMREDCKQLTTSWLFPKAFDYWFKQPVNNARLVASMTYMEKIPAFYALFEQLDGDWRAFYQAVSDMEDLTQRERDEKISVLLQKEATLQDLMKKSLI